MGLFDKFFGKKLSGDTSKQASKIIQLQGDDTSILTRESVGFKIIRPLTNEQTEKIDKSTLLLRTGQLYMHYWTDNLVCTDRNDPEWQNKVLFFWKAEEPFAKKALPPTFETFKRRHFLFTGDTSKISLQVGQAMPWFGMPGLGEKHVCELNGKKVTIPELDELGLIEYIEQVELTSDNYDILTKRDDYFFLIDDSVTPFQNGNFYLNEKPIPIHLAYTIGGIHIFKKVKPNQAE
ncbi:TNT domain-containing protein [Terrimonas sp. NA20]|uniref:TNT domain-containing protein n=1 Tax=Terrimonas ginsenosidimutans TaxID=2908004 RepID=A0ABS9KSV4_9BACT|nr:TNT domain-containing protein [Terrimonas ginsenosidimutans]MCG2615384.1 TNT domain-containing protein [Terrimonas ginsenosidimutans]